MSFSILVNQQASSLEFCTAMEIQAHFSCIDRNNAVASIFVEDM